jgi:hypothetical protein
MKLSGVSEMKIRTSKKLIFCTLLSALPLLCLANEGLECNKLKREVFSQSIQKDIILSKLEKKIQENDFCSKNIMGILYAEGIYLNKNFVSAYSIFSDLSNQNYPPSQFNLGKLLSTQSDHSTENLIAYLLGLTIKYMGTKEWGYIGTSARDFARDYIEDLKKTNNKQESITSLSYKFEEDLKNGMHLLHQQFVNKKQEQKEFEDSVATILMIGLMASRISMMQAQRIPNSTVNLNFPAMPNRLYHVTPLGGNMLYMMPLN